MKKIISVFILAVVVTGCSPELGSDAWCAEMKEKPKGDWTATEVKDFTKHCIF